MEGVPFATYDIDATTTQIRFPSGTGASRFVTRDPTDDCCRAGICIGSKSTLQGWMNGNFHGHGNPLLDGSVHRLPFLGISAVLLPYSLLLHRGVGQSSQQLDNLLLAGNASSSFCICRLHSRSIM